MNIAVIGAGKMGLPLACQFAHRGATVIAADVNEETVKAINAGRCLLDEPGVAELLGESVSSGRLSATTDTPSAVAKSDVVVVIVPALLTPERDVDIGVLLSVSAQIADSLRRGMMVSYETSLPVGGTRHLLLPVLSKSGLEAGTDFDLIFSPERVKSQTVLKQLTVNPKIVGGITPAAAARGVDFYRVYLGAPVINVGSLEAAEMIKLAGMVYRDVNIALANELARYAESVGIDLIPLIAAVNTDGEAALLQPGIGVGGHCAPVYPYFLIQDARRLGVPLTLAGRSRRINDGQANHALDRLENFLGTLRGRRVLILGLAFRPQVKEHAFSPAFLLQEELQRRGAEVFLHDPLYPGKELSAHGFRPAELEGKDSFAVLILNTAHPIYQNLNFPAWKVRGVQAVVDGRNLWDPARVEKAGIIYLGVGRPADKGKEAPSRVPITRPLLGSEEAEAAADVVYSGWVLQGPQVAALEKEFAAAVGAPFACAVSSGTTALHLALRAAGVKGGDEVITVSHSYIASANSVLHCGAVPVFVDIQPGTYNLNPALIENVVTPRTRAILCVHQMGMPCDLKAIVEIARRRSLLVIEDAACALGSEILWNGRWEKIGKPHGDIACFSFHPRKVITTGDGGMLTTADPEWDKIVRLLRQQGMSIATADRGVAKSVARESYPLLGYNYRLTDIQAAVAREQLKRLPHILFRRRARAERYRRLLAGIPFLKLPEEPPSVRSNWQSYCVRLPKGRDQRRVMEALLQEGIASRSGIMCAHREPAYNRESWSCGRDRSECQCPAGTCSRLGESERAQDECLLLPLFPEMTDEEQDAVASALRRACSAS